MKLKLDDKGAAVLENGLPVWVGEDGRETAYNVPDMVNKISALNGESAGRRKEIEALSEKLKPFEKVDPEKYRTMQETLAAIDQGKLLEAGKVEELKASVKKDYEQRFADMQKTLADKDATHKSEMDKVLGNVRSMAVKGLFERSDYLRDKTVLTPDIAFSSFGQNFTVEEDGNGYKISASINGQPILSRAKPGELATPEEALEAIIEAYPLKDRILKAPGGGPGTAGYNDTRGKSTISRAEFEKLDPAAKLSMVKDGKVAVVD